MSKQRVNRGLDPFDDMPAAPAIEELSGAAFDKVRTAAKQAGDLRLVLRDDGNIQIGSLVLTPTGIIHQGTVSESDLRLAGKIIRRIGESYNILAGDFLVRAELVWGKSYQQVAIELGYNIASCYNYKLTMGRIDFSLRSENLTYNHYYVAATKLKTDAERKHWLGLAVEHDWSYRTLQDEIEKTTPTPTKLVAGVAKLFTHNRVKYRKFSSEISRAGVVEKAQISQMIDEEIAELQKLRDAVSSAK